MKTYESTAQFYRSDDWQQCKAQVTAERIKSDGCLYCELCGKPIVKGFNPNKRNNAGAVVYHHKTYLTNLKIGSSYYSILPETTSLDTTKTYGLKCVNGTLTWVQEN